MGVTIERLTGLPPYGPPPMEFGFRRRQLHSEGVVIQITPHGQSSWIAHFEEGAGSLSTCAVHPDHQRVVVIAGGVAYVVNAQSRFLDLHVQGIDHLVRDESGSALLLFDAMRMYALTDGQWWTSPRISIDGFRALRISGSHVSGEAWDPMAEDYVSFSGDLQTQSIDGGSWTRGSTARMTSRLPERFLDGFCRRISGTGAAVAWREALTVIVPEAARSVGSIVITVSEEEILMHLGRHAHRHYFAYLDDEGQRHQTEDAAVRQAVDLIENVVHERVALWSLLWLTGGWFPITRRRGWIARMVPAYVWSGRKV